MCVLWCVGVGFPVCVSELYVFLRVCGVCVYAWACAYVGVYMCRCVCVCVCAGVCSCATVVMVRELVCE